MVFFRRRLLPRLFIPISLIFLFSLFSFSVDAQCDGCVDDEEKCFSYGIRKDGEFCSLAGTFSPQKNELSRCENNFECESNLCVEDRCVNAGIIKKILYWLKDLFFS